MVKDRIERGDGGKDVGSYVGCEFLRVDRLGRLAEANFYSGGEMSGSCRTGPAGRWDWDEAGVGVSGYDLLFLIFLPCGYAAMAVSE